MLAGSLGKDKVESLCYIGPKMLSKYLFINCLYHRMDILLNIARACIRETYLGSKLHVSKTQDQGTNSSIVDKKRTVGIFYICHCLCC